MRDLLLAVVGTFAVTFTLAWLLFRHEVKQLRIKEERYVKNRVKRAVQEQNESQLVLATIDIAVLFFASDDTLSISNEAAGAMLNHIPQTFHEFLDCYGEENGIRSQLVLGKEKAEAVFFYGSYVYHMLVQKIQAKLEEGQLTAGHIVLVRDVSRNFREEQQRKEFVSNVSHELRTPLTTIKTYSETLLDWGIPKQRTEQIALYVTRIYEDSLRMEKLIDDLTLLSKLDENSINRSMRVEQLDFAWLVKQVTERMQREAEEHGVVMNCTTMSQIPKVYADRSQMERVFVNLISNAIKYGREKGEINIYIGFLRDEVYVKVKDDGLGIEAADQEHIFDRFFRVDASGSRQHGGTGLGLAIVKQLVELHHGLITVNSVLTQGSEFTVMIPCAHKMLRQTLYELSQDEPVSGSVKEAVVKDLEQLAEGMGIMAQWQGLQNPEYKALLAKIEEETKISPLH